MAHFRLIFPPGTRHVTATTTIARELVQHGHRATAFNFLDVDVLVTREGVEFCPLGILLHPKGSVPRNFEILGRLGGLKFLRFGMKLATFEITTLLPNGSGTKVSGNASTVYSLRRTIAARY